MYSKGVTEVNKVESITCEFRNLGQPHRADTDYTLLYCRDWGLLGMLGMRDANVFCTQHVSVGKAAPTHCKAFVRPEIPDK